MSELFIKVRNTGDMLLTDLEWDDKFRNRYIYDDDQLKKVINICMDACKEKIDGLKGLTISRDTLVDFVITKYDAKDALESLKVKHD